MNTPTKIIKFLQNYNAWRRGDETLEMPHPAEIGANIQDAVVVLREHKKLTTRASRAEADVQRLKSDGAASAFIAMSCRASRAETDRNNLRADLDAIKAILTEEKARAERAEAELLIAQRLLIDSEDAGTVAENLRAELAAERARLDWLEDNSVCYHVCIDRQPDGYSIHNSPPSPGSVRAAIDAAMKEGAK
jgi:hypothetical protein